MGLLKLLGIEKYLKKVKTYVDEKASELDTRINNIKPDAPTPDWDARKGQEGYIKGKTHGLEDVTKLTANGQKADAFLETAAVKFGDTIYSVKRGEETVVSRTPDVSVRYEGYEVTLNDPEGFVNEQNPVLVAIAVKQLDEKYIPDTIARKSDIPSAPAVDETLMKYLANPYIIVPGQQIPEDLHNLIYEGGAGLKPVVMTTCVFYEEAESRVYRIEAVAEWEVYVYGGQQMSYNDLDRVFDY